MAYDVTPGAGTLDRLDADGAVSVVLEAVTISNGLAWTPDGRTAYYVDSPTKGIDVLDYDAEAGLTDRRPFVTVAAHHGLPDGLTVDREGGVWAAFGLRRSIAARKDDCSCRLRSPAGASPRLIGRDLEGIVRDYSDDAVFITPTACGAARPVCARPSPSCSRISRPRIGTYRARSSKTICSSSSGVQSPRRCVCRTGSNTFVLIRCSRSSSAGHAAIRRAATRWATRSAMCAASGTTP
jgi:hypothetical protein